MIIDAHAYCFEAWDSARGYASADEHLALVAEGNAGHHQPALRLSDGYMAGSDASAALTPLSMRLDKRRGRIVWDAGGESYTKHFAPPNLIGCEYSPYSLDAEMLYAGVDAALLHTNDMLVRDPTYYRDVAAAFPGRFYAMAPTNEALITTNCTAAIQAIRYGAQDCALSAIKFHVNSWYNASPERWDDNNMIRPYWKVVEQLGLPVFLTPGHGPISGQDNAAGFANMYPAARSGGVASSGRTQKADMQRGFLDEMATLARFLERYPSMTVSITHGFPWRTFLDDSGRGIESLPGDLFAPFESGRCNLEVSFPVRVGDVFEYPYTEVRPALRTLVERCGAEHLLWGTDMPFQNRFCTYRQSRTYIETHCSEFIDDAQLSLLLGGTAQRVLQIPDRPRI